MRGPPWDGADEIGIRSKKRDGEEKGQKRGIFKEDLETLNTHLGFRGT